MAAEDIIKKAREARAVIEDYAAGLNDEEALLQAWMFPMWKPLTQYKAGDRIYYEGTLYKVLQDHTAQNDWTPVDAVSLFSKVLIPTTDDNIVYEWEQPESTNPYAKGDVVSHNGKTWESDVDSNVWEPGVYGWHEVE